MFFFSLLSRGFFIYFYFKANVFWILPRLSCISIDNYASKGWSALNLLVKKDVCNIKVDCICGQKKWLNSMYGSG
jgi:hypothetical protein